MVHGPKGRQRIVDLIRCLYQTRPGHCQEIPPQLSKGKVQEQDVIAPDTVRKITCREKGGFYGVPAKEINRHHQNFRQGHHRKYQHTAQHFPHTQLLLPDTPGGIYHQKRNNRIHRYSITIESQSKTYHGQI